MDGLCVPLFEHDSCGVGFVASTGGRSHQIVERALEAVANLTHRGAVSADGKTGDGAGVLTQIPHRLLALELRRRGVRIDGHADLGVGMIFLPRDPERRTRSRTIAGRSGVGEVDPSRLVTALRHGIGPSPSRAKSSPVRTASTPGAAAAAAMSSARMRACACGERTSLTCSRP